MGLQSSSFPLVSFSTSGAVALDTDILPESLLITKDNLQGEAGLFRVWITFATTADVDFQMNVRRKNASDTVTTDRLLKLNGDNDFILKSGGYYRFDVDVIIGDEINFQSTVGLTRVDELRVHQIQIGA